jgi:hypothetical protein
VLDSPKIAWMGNSIGLNGSIRKEKSLKVNGERNKNKNINE